VPSQQIPATQTPGAVSADGNPQPKSIEWRDEFRAAGTFLRDHWALLGFIGLTLSAVAMHSYLVKEAIPLGIASQEIITSLPMLFILIVMAVVSMVGSLMLPTAVLVGRHKELAQNVLDEMLQRAGEVQTSHYVARLRLLGWWALGPAVPSMLVMLMLQWDWWQSHALGYFLPLVVATGLFTGGVVVAVSRVVPDTWRQHLRKRWAIILSCGFVQMFVGVSLGAVLETRFFSSDTGEFFVALAFVMALLAVMQVVFAWVVRDVTQGPGVLMRAMGIAGFLMFAVCMLPPLNHFFVGYVMQSSATGGRGCTVFTWKEKADVLSGLKQGGQGTLSVPLRIPMAIPGTYFVRPWDGSWGSDIAPVPAADVAKASNCPK